MILRRLTFLFILIFLVMSCGSRKPISSRRPTPKPNKEVNDKTDDKQNDNSANQTKLPDHTSHKDLSNTERYILTYADVAKEKMRQYGIPASITLAQGILESGSGTGRLAVKANNHFGIKCHDWTGAKIYHDDDQKGECFRKYKDAKYSFQDHSVFLTSRKRYHKLFDLQKDDYKGWAKGLKAAGYATDPRYPNKLIGLIERYQLYQYDAEALGKPQENIAEKQNSSVEHRIVKGDTLYSLSKRYDVSVDEIKRLNNLNSNLLEIDSILIIKK
jgi:flagellum-specific peptidoglycan hydrolase FlgJ